MQDDLASELKAVRRELDKCKVELSNALVENFRLANSASLDPLRAFRPREALEAQYGWVFDWLHPLFVFLEENADKPLTWEISGKITDIVAAIMAQLAVYGKYGVKLPNDPRPVDVAQFLKKQENILCRRYDPCAICGEKRITHESHILPRSEGGPDHRDNYVMLCPLHHHLFDHSRLSKTEWETLRSALDGKMEAAIVYADQVRLPVLQAFWKEHEQDE